MRASGRDGKASARGEVVVVVNPDDDVTADTFAAWLDRRQTGEPVEPGVSAAETLAEERK